MRYEKARQNITTKKWAYTSARSDDGAHAIGHCSGFTNGTSKDHQHDTAEEAELCYKNYQLDNLREIKMSNQQKKCQICGAWTDGAMTVKGDAGDLFILCKEHRNRESVEQIMPTPSEAWVS